MACYWLVINLLFQDPDLEAKRKAELEKIRSQKKKFKQKIQESIQRQKHGQMKKKQMKKKKAAQATAWKLLWAMYILNILLCNITVKSEHLQ